MKVSDFDFDLPEELIAQHPLERRDSSRLVVSDRNTGEIEHKSFHDVIEYLDEGDTLVLNNTRVMSARLIGEKEGTGGKIEFLLLKRIEDDRWECLAKPGKRAKVDQKFTSGEGELIRTVVNIVEEGNRIIGFSYEGIFEQVLDELGEMPPPPYITGKLEDRKRYQTIYSKEKEPAAAPAAGLHFTEELLKEIKAKGVDVAYLILHVGLGTFRPVKVEDIDECIMHSGYHHLDNENIDLINETKKRGNKVIAVGTTPTRNLETIGDDNGFVREQSGWTDIFIYPGYKHKVTDELVTNFHLPESTLIMLVSALAGKEHVVNAYSEAVKEKYRFFSFGDSMLIKE